MIIAGEASGDLHGANLVRAMRKHAGNLSFFGIGGPAMKKQGVDVLLDAARLSVVGITEVFSKLPDLFRGRAAARRMLHERRPDLLVLIDFPDFNLHMAGAAKRMGIPVLYYISPQIWAWRRGRIRKIRRRVDRMAVILPFEERFYAENGVPVTFVGHPLLDELEPAAPERSAPPGNRPVIALLPGSRDREVQRLLPVMLEGARRLADRGVNARFLLSAAPTVERDTIQETTARFGRGLDLEITDRPVGDLFAAVTAAVAASGTVTLQAAIAGTPTVIVYTVSKVSYRFGKILIRVPFIGLANLIAGRSIMPELIQEQATPEAVADALAGLIRRPERLEAIRAELGRVRDALGSPGASDRTARLALGMLGMEAS